ncbi:hypothetical protein SDC9_191793 [bioreactor metagenome]|uniref:Uncharacterized protein n=1 Tax=bioreactor metagenome TaxID=1076179 RepID=A0A645I0F9_9ZZZZ
MKGFARIRVLQAFEDTDYNLGSNRRQGLLIAEQFDEGLQNSGVSSGPDDFQNFKQSSLAFFPQRLPRNVRAQNVYDALPDIDATSIRYRFEQFLQGHVPVKATERHKPPPSFATRLEPFVLPSAQPKFRLFKVVTKLIVQASFDVRPQPRILFLKAPVENIPAENGSFGDAIGQPPKQHDSDRRVVVR